MKTTTLTLSALALLAGLAACTKENFNPSSSSDTHNDGNGLKVTLVAGQENEAGTRAAIGETTDNKTTILWSANDKLSVFDGANKNIEFTLTGDAGKTSGTFEGEVGATSESYVALHPYQEVATINSERNTINGVTLKSVQTAVAGSFDPAAALMVATESTDGNLAFKNVVGYIKVTPGFACKKITLTSNNTDDALAGTEVSISLADGTPTVSSVSGASYSVSVSGDIAANTTYYIAALPATLKSGFKLIFTDSDGNKKSRASSGTLTIKRNTITDLGTVNSTDVSTYIPYVTFSAASEQGFIMELAESGLESSTFEYLVGDGDTWTNVTSITSEGVPFGGDKGNLRLRGKSLVGTATNANNYSNISFTETEVEVQCSGDIRTLIDYEKYASVETKDARFAGLFQYCTALTSAPELPATTLADNCYYWMFAVCSSLKTAPTLPAERLADSCYEGMFFDCSALASAPDLPAETLAVQCYSTMFLRCTKLETAPALPATKLEKGCYNAMFSGCTELNSEIELPAETLVESCYTQMFSGCTKLTSITIKATSIASSTTQSKALLKWLYKTVPSVPDGKTRTIHKRESFELSTDSYSGIPTGWVAVNDVTD